MNGSIKRNTEKYFSSFDRCKPQLCMLVDQLKQLCACYNYKFYQYVFKRTNSLIRVNVSILSSCIQYIFCLSKRLSMFFVDMCVCFLEDTMMCPPQSLFVNHCLNLFQVLQCNCSVNTVTFPVTVTQQSPAAVSMDTYQITMKPMQAQVKYK